MWVRLVKRSLLGVAVVACFAAASGVSVASAEELTPWWGVTTGARPTNLQSGVAKGEVMELTVSATGGEFAVIETPQFKSHLFAWNASAETVQKGLEEIYGSRRIEVSGGPGDEGGTKPYVITFPGQQVELPLAGGGYPVFFGGEDLSGGRAEANLTEVTKGTGPDGQIIATAQNRGDGNAEGATTPVTVADKLPAGVEAVQIEGVGSGQANRAPISCNLKSLSCTFTESLEPYEQIEVRVGVIVRPGATSGGQDTASVSGGGAVGSRTGSHAIEMNGTTKYGIEDYQVIPENVGGSLDTQAGSHPFQLTSLFTLNTQSPGERYGNPRTVALPKDIVAELPTGLVGNPTPFTQCTDVQFAALVAEPDGRGSSDCPAQSAIGVATTSYAIGNGQLGFITLRDPIFNITPRTGEPARFGFKVQGIVPVFLDTSVRTGKDYGITVSSSDITQISWLTNVKLTFWGVPGDSRHDNERGWECVDHFGTCSSSTGSATPPPFLMLPTSCEQPFETTVHSDSWGSSAQASEQAEPVSYRLPEAMDGCDRLPFAPKITVSPDIPNGSSSTGLTVGVHVPQEASLDPSGLGESALKNSTVALPEGVGLNPAGAGGLEACSEAQIGFTGVDPVSGTDTFTSSLPEPFCPDASKIGTVKIKTPLLPNPLEGAVYLASPAPQGEEGKNPFKSLIAMYIVAQDPTSGTLVKLPGEVKPDPVTGQLVATFKNTPELPFEELELHFFGGERAPLGTPGLCGAYTTTAAFAPWSGSETAQPSSSFDVISGPNGKPCANPLPFAPALTAGTTSIQAGGFSPFTMTMSREDGNQNLKAIELHMPPGLSGTLSTVKLCGEEPADAGTCPTDTEIGETIVSVGLGGDPFSVTGGKVFITGPYKGAPFGLSIVNPAKAGPFDLGQVVVRAKIEVNPITSALTITSDSEGPYKIPTIIDGIPLQIKHINVTVNRQNFTFNPTNCSPLAITGKLISSEGATSALSIPFQATNCAVLAFKPKLTATTSGKTSRKNGASLSVKLTYPAGPYDANIAKVKVDLPKQLPSVLTTLQKACLAATFEANPASCPPGSIVGSARATTPVLPVPLVGPAYFVSYGGAKFPELVIVLSGYGVTVQLHGETFINSSGITSSTFKSIPDVPVGTFELTLPSGPGSALAANGNFCKSKLVMPTSFVAQNGATINTTTPIAVTDCKPEINVTGHNVKGKAVTITTSVPSAGKLVASGAGLSSAAKKIGKAGNVTLTLKLAKAQRLLLSKHPGHKLKVAIKLSFTPSHGQKLSGGTTVLIG
jgi:hypothetical protein